MSSQVEAARLDLMPMPGTAGRPRNEQPAAIAELLPGCRPGLGAERWSVPL